METAVEIENFSYSYSDGATALQNINLKIQRGQKVVLIGPNGAGKSTLLLAIAGFIHGQGRILVEGLEICSKNLKQIRALMGCCLEDPDDQLFMPTIYEDVAFGPLNMNLPHQQVRDNIDFALSKTGLATIADRAPHHLSAGQKRNAAIATVLAMSPQIITLDEPDGSLDPRNRRNLEDLLRKLSQTLIIATCNIRFAAAAADRAVIINGGKIIADGSMHDIVYDTKLMLANGLETP